MAKKVFEGFAFTLCSMAVSERITADGEVLASLPDGLIIMDLLTGISEHSSVGQVSMGITDELRKWLLEQMRIRRIDPARVCEARLEFAFDTNRIKTHRESIILFHLDATAVISADRKSYRGSVAGAKVWYNRPQSMPHLNPPDRSSRTEE